MQDPQSLHKYLYVHGDPVNMTDPSGLFGVGGMVVSIGIALGNVSTELVAGGLIVSMLETGGKAGFGAREAGLILIANGEFDSGIRLYHLGVRVIGLTFATIDSVDTAIGLGALGIGLAFAAYKIARHAPDLAQSALNFSRKALDTRQVFRRSQQCGQHVVVICEARG